MLTRFVAALAIAVPLATQAGEEPVACPDFGLNDSALQQLFCAQLNGILRQTGSDRSSGSDIDLPPKSELDNAPWRRLDGLNRAFERDPKKTLELIDRIRSAGGLDSQ